MTRPSLPRAFSVAAAMAVAASSGLTGSLHAAAPVTAPAEEKAPAAFGPPSSRVAESEGTEVVQPANLLPEGEKMATANALYAEALRTTTRRGFAAAVPLYEQALQADPSLEDAYLKLANYYVRQSDPAKALAVLQAGFIANPDSPEVKAALAYAHHLMRNNLEALRIAKEVIAVRPDQATASRVIFEIYDGQGKGDEAIKIIESTAGAKATQKAEFWTRLARTYTDLLREKGNPSESELAMRTIALYEKAVTLGPPSTDALVLLADAEKELGRVAPAMKHFRAALELDDKSVGALLGVAELEQAAGHQAESMKFYERAYEEKPDLVGLREMLAIQYTENGQPEKAIGMYEALIEDSPMRSDYYLELGKNYEKLRKIDKAEENYAQAVALQPRSSLEYLYLAMAQLAQKKGDKAMTTLTEARRKFPNSARVMFVLGLAQRQAKSYEEALGSFSQAKILAAGTDDDLINEKFYLEYAATQELSGKKAESEETLKQAIKKYPDNPDLLNSLAYTWAEQGRNLDEALKMSVKSNEAEPDNGAFLDTLAWTYFQLKRYPEALAPMEKAARLIDDDPVVLNHLAEVYSRLNRQPDAIGLWQKVLSLDPANPDATERLKAAHATPLPDAKSTP